MSMIPANTLVVVADAGAVHVFRNTGSESELKLSSAQLPELSEDAAGHGPAGHQPQSRDRDEMEFLRNLALRINDAALKNKFDHLILAADPISLGELRKQLHKEVQAKMLAEVAKDWTHMDVKHIETAIGKLRVG